MESETEFRDFSDVITDLSAKWNILNEAEQASIAKALAGTRQRENFLVLMNNMSMATDLTTQSVDSNGLAMERYDIYLESTEAKLNTLKATLESVFTKTLNSGTVNILIEMGTGFLNMAEAVGGLVPVLGSVGIALLAIKNVGGAK